MTTLESGGGGGGLSPQSNVAAALWLAVKPTSGVGVVAHDEEPTSRTGGVVPIR